MGHGIGVVCLGALGRQVDGAQANLFGLRALAAFAQHEAKVDKRVRHSGLAADDVTQHPFGVAQAPGGLQGRGQVKARRQVVGRVVGQVLKGGYRLDLAAGTLVDEAKIVEARRMTGQRAQHFREQLLSGAQIALALAFDSGLEGLTCARVVHGLAGSRSLEAL